MKLRLRVSLWWRSLMRQISHWSYRHIWAAYGAVGRPGYRPTAGELYELRARELMLGLHFEEDW